MKIRRIIGLKKLFFMDICRVLFTAVFVCFTIQVIGQEENSGKLIKSAPDQYRAQVPGWEVVDRDTSKWHPKKFYIIYTDRYTDIRIIFKFPYEEDQSGVRNMLFLNKQTGKIRLLDEERPLNEYRKFTEFDSEKYDVILLYNNGTYIRYNDVIFEKGGCMEIDMTQSEIQPSGSKSEEWLTMRAFNDVIGNAKRKIKMKGDTRVPALGVEIRGYVFAEEGDCLPWIFMFSNSTDFDNLLTISEDDGYFLVKSNDTSQSLYISNSQSYFPCEITVTVDCGIFAVLKRNHDFDNIRFGDYSEIKREQ
ncbi:MAG: hypothetical protein LBH60_09805 [Prevotellaceae bacterium]|jgi:hypothetical protein|nr:hypothetical protein [Prevotellaceae bacterium]